MTIIDKIKSSVESVTGMQFIYESPQTINTRLDNMPMPCGIIAMSPWTDVTASGESYTTNYEKDPLFGNTRESLIYINDYISINI